MAERLAIVSGDTAEDVRLGLGALWTPNGSLKARSGLVPDGGGALTKTSGMSASVSAYRAVIAGGTTSTQGAYQVAEDAAVTLTFADGGAVDRVDQVVAHVYDTAYDASGQTKFATEIVQGNTSTGAAGAVPASAIVLWQVTIPAGRSAGNGGLDTARFVDKRPFAAALGGTMSVSNQAERDALTNLVAGVTRIWRRDTLRTEVYNGSGWEVVATTTRVALHAKRSAAQSIPSGTAQQLLSDVAIEVTSSIYSWNASTGVLTLNQGGTFGFSFRWQFAASVGANLAFVSLETPIGSYRTPVGNGGQTASASAIVPLNAGDTVSTQIFQSSGAAINGTGDLHVSRLCD